MVIYFCVNYISISKDVAIAMDVCWRELAATPPAATMPSPPHQQQSQHYTTSSAGNATGIMAGIGKSSLRRDVSLFI